MIPFKDISYAQGQYDMASNTDEIVAIRMSSGDGGLHFDSQATANYNAAHAAGKVIIQYHYCGNADPATEAKFFIEACSPFSEYDCYAIDAELGQTQEWKQTFVNTVQQATGCWCLNYMNISTANSLGSLPNCGNWIAAPSWGFNADITELNSGLGYVAQQGPVVSGVDTDMWFGTVDELKEYGYHLPTTTTTTTTSTTSTSSTTTTTLPPIPGTVINDPLPPTQQRPVIGPQPPPRTTFLERLEKLLRDLVRGV